MDKKVISCAFNIDTACVEVKFTDGRMISLTAPWWKPRFRGICTRVMSWSGWYTMRQLTM